MPRIQKISHIMTIILNCLIIMIPVCTVTLWLYNQSTIWPVVFSKSLLINTPEGVIDLWNISLTPLQRSVGIIASFIGFIPHLLGAVILKKLFINYQKGQIFTLENTLKYKKLGYLFFINAFLAHPLSELGMVLATTLGNPPGHRYISLGFGTPNLEMLFCGALVIIISWVMAEAHKLQDDNNLTI